MRKKDYSIKILPFKSANHPEYRFAAYYTDRQTEQRKRCIFKTEAEAKCFDISERTLQAHGYSTGKVPLSELELWEYKKMCTLLNQVGGNFSEVIPQVANWIRNLEVNYNESLGEALETYIKCDITKLRVKHLKPTVNEYIQRIAQTTTDRRGVYLQQNKLYLGSFVEFFGDADPKIDEIDSTCILEWHKKYSLRKGHGGRPLSEVARYNALHYIKVFFSYCKRLGLVSRNPVTPLETRILPKTEPKFYTVEESAKILYATPKDSFMRLFIVLSLLGGFRHAEVLRMKWKHLNFEYNDVSIDGSMTKTHMRRKVILPENAKKWLLPYSEMAKNPEEYIFPWNEVGGDVHKLYSMIDSVFEKAGVERIKNGFRHTAATYHYAMSGNSIESSDQLGNTPIILKTHYMALTTKAKAKEFYSILPKD